MKGLIDLEDDLRLKTWLYWGYLTASIVAGILVFGLGLRIYVFASDEATLSDLFFLLFAFLGSIFLRINAFHYQKLLAISKLQEAQLRRPKRKQNKNYWESKGEEDEKAEN